MKVVFKLLDIFINLIGNALEVKLFGNIGIGVTIKSTIASTFFTAVGKNDLNILDVVINILEYRGDKFLDGCFVGRKQTVDITATVTTEKNGSRTIEFFGFIHFRHEVHD